MSIPAKQIGWSTEANLLYEILKKLDQINKTLGTAAPVIVTTTTTVAPATTTTTTTL